MILKKAKKILLVFVIGVIAITGCDTGSTPHSYTWTWMSGDKFISQSGVYGTMGTADQNNIPGARDSSQGWVDSNGNLWLMGGNGYDYLGTYDVLNDLWMFDVSTEQWTWVDGSKSASQSGVYGTQGSEAAANIPGARLGAITWVDSDGNFWLFGGIGYDSAGTYSYLNDLWKFTISTGEWTWISGGNLADQNGVYGTMGNEAPTNVPGSRSGAIAWLSSDGRLMLFGGRGFDSAGTTGYLNDLWVFDPTSSQWTWLKGNNTANSSGNYGTQGTESVSNNPGSRNGAVSWVDANGKLWMLGGYGYPESSFWGYLNDLWMYNPTTNNWIWVNGSKIEDESGVYGTKNEASSANTPGSRRNSHAWIDEQGDIMLMGGQGYDKNALLGVLNDLWKYDSNSNMWIWLSGNDTRNNSGQYGTIKNGTQSTYPGSRSMSITWFNSRLWMFGGYGYDSVGSLEDINDLWLYQ